jgi:hypothetical protein
MIVSADVESRIPVWKAVGNPLFGAPHMDAMQVTVQLPDELAPELGNASEMPRKLLEAFAADGYRSGTLSRGQVRRLLGLDYWQTDEFRTQHGALREYSLSDLEIDRRSLDTCRPNDHRCRGYRSYPVPVEPP